MHAGVINVGFINPVFIFHFILFPYGSENVIWHVAHWSDVAWMFLFFVKAHR